MYWRICNANDLFARREGQFGVKRLFFAAIDGFKSANIHVPLEPARRSRDPCSRRGASCGPSWEGPDNMGALQLNGKMTAVTGGGGIRRCVASLLTAAGAGVAVFAQTGRLLTETIELIKQEGDRSIGPVSPQDARSKDVTLRIDRTIATPRDKVFRAWIDPEAAKRWFVYGAPVHWSEETGPSIDARPGGSYRWSVVSDGNENDVFNFHGTYRQVTAPARLSFTWEWESLPIDGVDGPGKTLVTLEFFDEAGATTVVLTQVGFWSDAARDAHAKGWARCFDGLAESFR